MPMSFLLLFPGSCGGWREELAATWPGAYCVKGHKRLDVFLHQNRLAMVDWSRCGERREKYENSAKGIQSANVKLKAPKKAKS